MNWPQVIFIALQLAGVIINVAFHGKRKPEHSQYFNAGGSFIAACISMGLLYWGGFFEQ